MPRIARGDRAEPIAFVGRERVPQLNGPLLKNRGKRIAFQWAKAQGTKARESHAFHRTGEQCEYR
jgi:hypothetical protein